MKTQIGKGLWIDFENFVRVDHISGNQCDYSYIEVYEKMIKTKILLQLK